MRIEDSKEKTFQQGLFVGHGHSNRHDKLIESFRCSASGRNKLPTYQHGKLPIFSERPLVDMSCRNLNISGHANYLRVLSWQYQAYATSTQTPSYPIYP